MTASSLISVRVARKQIEADDIYSLELTGELGTALPTFEPGAHIDVHVGQAIVRQYSLCNASSPAQSYRIAVLRDPRTRGGSKAIHDQIHEGDSLHISPPRNLFPLQSGGHLTILFAGGIGITPLLAMAWQLCERGRPFQLHYFVRTRSRAAFVDEMQSSPFAQQVTLHVDDEPGKNASVATLLQDARAAVKDTHIYACGPAGFLNHVLETTNVQGWPEEQVHYESFTPVQLAGGESFEVRISSLGQSVTVAPDETVISAVARLGLDIPVSCEQGICGTCLTKVLEGTPDHKDMYLTDEERAANDQFMPCCSRSISPVLVLDL